MFCFLTHGIRVFDTVHVVKMENLEYVAIIDLFYDYDTAVSTGFCVSVGLQYQINCKGLGLQHKDVLVIVSRLCSHYCKLTNMYRPSRFWCYMND